MYYVYLASRAKKKRWGGDGSDDNDELWREKHLRMLED
jgi:hypothetical protein